MIYSIYKIVNKNNNKTYIGFTDNPKRRWREHRTRSGNNTKALYRAIKKYGIESFQFDIVYQSKDRDHTLLIMEPQFVNEYKSFGPDGYNMNGGGGNINTPDMRNKSRLRMQKNNPMVTLRTNKGSFKRGHVPIITAERNAKISLSKLGSNNPNYGKLGNADKMNVRLRCSVCGVETNAGNIARWHKHTSNTVL